MGESEHRLKTVNWSGVNFDLSQGYGYHSIKYLTALDDVAGDRYNFVPVLRDLLDWPTRLVQMSGVDLTNPMFFVGQPTHANIKNVPGRVWLNTMFESTGLPEGWVSTINLYTERLITPSEWLVTVFKSSGVDVPIHVIPEGIDPEEFPIIEPKDPDPFVFTCMGDRGTRKGHDLTYAAFYRAFGKNPKGVKLVIKSRETNLPEFRDHFFPSAIRFWRHDVSHMSEVYRHTNCFVFPTKGEGYGLPPREASAMGIPTICTNASGTQGADKWAFPLNNNMWVKSPYGGQWIRADVDELAQKMLWVKSNYDEAVRQAKIHAQWLRDNETWHISARKIAELMDKHL